ncbi:MAG: ABC transporter substrate-binding protein [Chloroflexota bacterium]|nr:ABC transporter substrate-binding protein [Chloroflexota bacterium]
MAQLGQWGVLAGGGILAACGASGTGGGQPTAGGQAAKIGAAFTLTGGASVYGQAQKNAVQLAVEEINSQNAVPGVKLDVLYEDDAGDKAAGINVFQKFINGDRVLAMMGPTLSNVALAADPIAQQAGVPVLGVSNTANGVTEIGNFIFRDSLTEAVVIPNTVKRAKEKLGLKRVAILYGNDDSFTKSGYDEFKKSLDASGVQIANTLTFATLDKDFSAQLTQLKSANPDALIVSALIAAAVGIVTQARQLLGDKIPIVGGNGLNSPALMQQSGRAAEGVVVGAAWHVSSNNPKSQAFIKAYQAKYNGEPDQFAAQAYAGLYILAEAIKRAGASPTRDGVRKALSEIKALPTALGTFSFTAARDADHPPVVQVVKDGKFAVLE